MLGFVLPKAKYSLTEWLLLGVRFAKSQTVGASFKAKRPMSRLETVESEEERWAEDRLLSSRGGGGGWRGVGVVYTGRWAGPPPPRYRVRPGSTSVLGRPPEREGLFLAHSVITSKKTHINNNLWQDYCDSVMLWQMRGSSRDVVKVVDVELKFWQRR